MEEIEDAFDHLLKLNDENESLQKDINGLTEKNKSLCMELITEKLAYGSALQKMKNLKTSAREKEEETIVLKRRKNDLEQEIEHINKEVKKHWKQAKVNTVALATVKKHLFSSKDQNASLYEQLLKITTKNINMKTELEETRQIISQQKEKINNTNRCVFFGIFSFIVIVIVVFRFSLLSVFV